MIVSSVGGHLDEIMQLAPLLEDAQVVLVVNDSCELPDYPFSAVYRIVHAERDWRVAVNLAEAARILLHEDPDLLLSAGAGPIVPFALLARLLGRPRIVFVESASAVEQPTLSGKIMYRLADDFFYQWPTLTDHFPRGRCASVLFR